jgi:hypothetical protein
VTVGISATQAGNVLNLYRNTAGTALTPFVQLHTADPGAAGTTGISAGSTTRNAITWNAPSAGSMTLATLSAWTNGGTTETISHVSLWTLAAAGVFLQSFALSSSQPWVSTNTLTITTFTVSFTPIAA